jgi:HPt (histidine-containing phosphotransfer) domain-containing protein
MNAIAVPKSIESKYFDRPKVDDAIKPLLTDSASTARHGPPNDSGTSDRVFDVQAALDYVGRSRDLLRNMVGLFSMQWRERLAEMVSAASRRDGAALELIANRLKRSLGSVGARKASRVAEEFEKLGCKRSFHDLEETGARLGIEIERLVIELKEFCKETVPESFSPSR